METQRMVNRQPERGPITTHTINLKRKHTGRISKTETRIHGLTRGWEEGMHKGNKKDWGDKGRRHKE